MGEQEREQRVDERPQMATIEFDRAELLLLADEAAVATSSGLENEPEVWESIESKVTAALDRTGGALAA